MTIPKSLESLEQQRANIADQIAALATCVVARSLPPPADVANRAAIVINPKTPAMAPISA